MPNRNNNRMGRIDEEYRKELSQIISYNRNDKCYKSKSNN